jgi:hypothetical protein
MGILGMGHESNVGKGNMDILGVATGVTASRVLGRGDYEEGGVWPWRKSQTARWGG